MPSLMAAVEAALSGSRVALSELGRGLRNRVAVKHNIKRIHRLLGNGALHAETPGVYDSLTRQCLAGVQTPLILIDWSDLTPDRRWQVLRASVALAGRGVTLYEQIHPLSRATSARVHAKFLTRLASMLPRGCVPIVITDAGFRSPWFGLVNRMGWQWIGRIRNRARVRPIGGVWRGCKALYAKATGTAQALGHYEYVRSNPLVCHLVLIKRRSQRQHQRTVHGKRVRSCHSLKQARTIRRCKFEERPQS